MDNNKYRRRANRFEDLLSVKGKEISSKTNPKIHIDSMGKTSILKDIIQSPSTQYMSLKIPSSPYVRRNIYKNTPEKKNIKKLSSLSSLNNIGETNDLSQKLSSEQKIHMNGCSYHLKNMCLCKDVMILEKRQRERSIKNIIQESNQELLQNTSIEGSILAGDLVGLHYRNEIENRPCNSTELYGDSSYYSDISSRESVSTNQHQYLKPINKYYNYNKYDISNRSSTSSSSSSSTVSSAAYLADVSNSHDFNSFGSQVYQTLVHQYGDEKSQPINPFLRRLVKEIDHNILSDDDDNNKNLDEPNELFTKLSQSYIENPNKFTGKLLSILEKSCIDEDDADDDDDDNNNKEKYNLSKKYVNICENINDELLTNKQIHEQDQLKINEITEDYTDLGVSITLDNSLLNQSMSDDKNPLNHSFLIEENEVNRSIMIEAVKKRNDCYEIEQNDNDDNDDNNNNNNKNKRNSINDIKENYNFSKIKNMFETIAKTNNYCNYLNEHKKNIRDVTTRVIDKNIDVDHQKSTTTLLSPSVYFDACITKETPASRLALRNAQGLKNNWISPTYLKKNQISSTTNNDKHLELKKSYSIDSGKNTLTPSFSDSDKSLNGWEVFCGRKKNESTKIFNLNKNQENNVNSTNIYKLKNNENIQTEWEKFCGRKPIISPVGEYIRGGGDDSKLISSNNKSIKIHKSTEV